MNGVRSSVIAEVIFVLVEWMDNLALAVMDVNKRRMKWMKIFTTCEVEDQIPIDEY